MIFAMTESEARVSPNPIPAFDIEAPDLEINDTVNVVLLFLERHEVWKRSKLRIVLDPDREILAQLAREASAGSKRCLAVLAETGIDDGVDDKLIISPAKADDGSDLQVPFGL